MLLWWLIKPAARYSARQRAQSAPVSRGGRSSHRPWSRACHHLQALVSTAVCAQAAEVFGAKADFTSGLPLLAAGLLRGCWFVPHCLISSFVLGRGWSHSHAAFQVHGGRAGPDRPAASCEQTSPAFCFQNNVWSAGKSGKYRGRKSKTVLLPIENTGRFGEVLSNRDVIFVHTRVRKGPRGAPRGQLVKRRARPVLTAGSQPW